jgi:hypothetical protein
MADWLMHETSDLMELNSEEISLKYGGTILSKKELIWWDWMLPF